MKRPRAVRQSLLTEHRFTKSGCQHPFHVVCADCPRVLGRKKNKQGLINGRGPVCQKRYMNRKPK